MAESSSIIVCGQRFDVGRRVITWEDDPKISAYTPHCVSRDCIFPFAPADPGHLLTKGCNDIPDHFKGDRPLTRRHLLNTFQRLFE